MVLHAQMRTRTRQERRRARHGCLWCAPTTRSSGRAGARVLDAEQRSADRERVEGRSGAVGRERSLFERERRQDSVHSNCRQRPDETAIFFTEKR